jgi:hypothetical protein
VNRIFPLAMIIPSLLFFSGCVHQPTPEERLQESTTKLLENYIDLLNDQVNKERERVQKGEEPRFLPR